MSRCDFFFFCFHYIDVSHVTIYPYSRAKFLFFFLTFYLFIFCEEYLFNNVIQNITSNICTKLSHETVVQRLKFLSQIKKFYVLLFVNNYDKKVMLNLICVSRDLRFSFKKNQEKKQIKKTPKLSVIQIVIKEYIYKDINCSHAITLQLFT